MAEAVIAVTPSETIKSVTTASALSFTPSNSAYMMKDETYRRLEKNRAAVQRLDSWNNPNNKN